MTSYSGRVRAWTLDGDVSTDEVAAAMSDDTHPMWGRVTDYSEEHNLVTNMGRSRMVLLAVAESTRFASHIALSTSSITPALSDMVTAIPDRVVTAPVTLAQSYASYYQQYITYFGPASFSSTAIATAALLDAASTAATTNLWAESSITLAKSTSQAAVLTWQIGAST